MHASRSYRHVPGHDRGRPERPCEQYADAVVLDLSLAGDLPAVPRVQRLGEPTARR